MHYVHVNGVLIVVMEIPPEEGHYQIVHDVYRAVAEIEVIKCTK